MLHCGEIFHLMRQQLVILKEATVQVHWVTGHLLFDRKCSLKGRQWNVLSVMSSYRKKMAVTGSAARSAKQRSAG